jgi:hypothetical protein
MNRLAMKMKLFANAMYPCCHFYLLQQGIFADAVFRSSIEPNNAIFQEAHSLSLILSAAKAL